MAPFRLRALPAVLVLAATACAQAAPSPAPPAAPTVSATAGLSAPELASLAGRNAAARGTVTARLDAMVTGQRVTGRVAVGLDGDRCTYDLTMAKAGRVQLIKIADRFWMKAPSVFSHAGALRPMDSYVRITAEEYPAADLFCRTVIQNVSLARSLQDPAELRREGAGEGRIRMTDRYGTVVEVSDTATPLPLLVRADSDVEYCEIAFSEYGLPVEPVEPPPAQTVDFSSLGLGKGGATG
ncbi:hypothetical protein ACWCYY_00330 [Kitasatospora sp. NPDC001664]